MTNKPREAIARALNKAVGLIDEHEDGILLANDVIAALKADGWRIVPEELSEQMLFRGYDKARNAGGARNMLSAYRAFWSGALAAHEDGE